METLLAEQGLTAYLDDGHMETTKELRQRPAVDCVDDWQRCHNVGLNLLKQILNHYSLVRQLRLTRREFLTLRRDVNDARLNIRCCSPEANAQDKEIEAAVLAHIFAGAPLVTPAAQTMFQQLVDFLDVVRRHLGGGSPGGGGHVGTILEELQQGQFPLQRYCFECDAPAQLYQTGGSRLAFCCAECQDEYHNK